MPRLSRLAKLTPLVAITLPTLLWIGSQTQADTPVLDPASLGMRPTEGAFLSAGRLASYETDLGSDIHWFVAMAGREDPNDMRGSVRGQLTAADAVLPTVADRMNLVMTVPLAFGKGSAATEAGRAAIRDGLLETAGGAWDEHYRQVAATLVEGGYPDTVIRLGHEFTGGWYPWSAQGNPDAYIAAYQHVHDVFRSVSPAFTFEWNAARNTFVEYGPPAYPGDDYVDVMGLDVYYEPWKGDPAVFDNSLWNRRYLNVLTAHRDFAAAHGKPVSYAEWAVGDVDEPDFVASMHSWLASLPESGPGSLLYHSYFNPARDTYSLDNFPTTKATYLDLFGGAADVPASTLPATTLPATTLPATTLPATTLPATTLPATTLPATTLPATTLPATTLPTRTATQQTLFDYTGTQTSDIYWEPPVNQPADYTAPADFANGHVYLKLDLTSKPSDKAMQPLLCFWRHGETQKFQFETCSPGKAVTITATGTYWLDLGAPQSWWKKAGGYDWAKQASIIRIMFRDPTTGLLFMGGKCGAACYPGDDLADHIPLTYSGEAILVAKGATLAPPADWAGCPRTFSAACTTGGSTTTSTTVPPSSTTPGIAPVVDVPASWKATAGTKVTLPATVDAASVRWWKVSGPSMTWTAQNVAQPSVVFPTAGTYVLQVRATRDGMSVAERMTVVVTASGGTTTTTVPVTTTPVTTLPSGTPTLTIRSDSATEGTNLVFKLVLSGASSRPVTVDLATIPNTALEGVDYAARAGRYVIPAGQTSVYVGVPTIKDGAREGSETMRLSIVSVSGASAAKASGLGTIND